MLLYYIFCFQSIFVSIFFVCFHIFRFIYLGMIIWHIKNCCLSLKISKWCFFRNYLWCTFLIFKIHNIKIHLSSYHCEKPINIWHVTHSFHFSYIIIYYGCMHLWCELFACFHRENAFLILHINGCYKLLKNNIKFPPCLSIRVPINISCPSQPSHLRHTSVVFSIHMTHWYFQKRSFNLFVWFTVPYSIK